MNKFSLEDIEWLLEEKHGHHDQRTHGNRFRTRGGSTVLAHLGGGPPGDNVGHHVIEKPARGTIHANAHGQPVKPKQPTSSGDKPSSGSDKKPGADSASKPDKPASSEKPVSESTFKDDLAGKSITEKEEVLAKSSGDKWVKGLSKKEKDAIETYTGSGYAEMNASLRKKPPKETAQTKTVQSALLKSKAPVDMVVSRGYGNDPALLEKFKQAAKTGGVFKESGFASTSIDPGMGFAGFKVNIKVHKGAPGAYVAPVSAFSHEREFLIPHGAEFKVTKAYKKKGKWQFDVDYHGSNFKFMIDFSVKAEEGEQDVVANDRSDKFVCPADGLVWLDEEESEGKSIQQFPTYSIKGREVEYKTFSFAVKSVDQDEGIVTYLASPITEDRQKDIVEPGAYAQTLQEGQARMQRGRKFICASLWMHDPKQPTGGIISGRETPEGLEVEIKYDISTNAAGYYNNPTAAMVFSGAKIGYVDESSVGYVAVKYFYDKQHVRHITQMELIEVSGVTMGFAANPDALAIGVKTMNEDTITEDNPDGGKKPARKDFNTLLQAAASADCFEDWVDLINTLTLSMIQIFGMGDQPKEDMITCLDQFREAVMEWVDDAIESDLAGYIDDRGYCDAYGGPHVPYQARVGGYDYSSRHDTISGKVGRAISSSNQGILEEHQDTMQKCMAGIKSHMATMQKSVSKLSDMYGSNKPDQEEGDQQEDGKSQHKPLDTKHMTIEDLAAVLGGV